MRRKSQKVILALMLIFAIISASLVMSVASFTSENQKSLLKFKLRNPTGYNLTHVITITNLGVFPIHKAVLKVPLIGNSTPFHFSFIEKIERNMNYGFIKMDSDPYLNHYVVWEIGEIEPKKQVTLKIVYTLVSFHVYFQINAENIEKYDKSSEIYQLYTQPEDYIESNDPEIIRVAQEIVGNETNPYLKAMRIAVFIEDNIAYEPQNQERGAKWALTNRKGDCSEYSYLFTALCRAVGIPARIQAGFSFHTDDEVIDQGHMWAEYYLENYGWIPVDLTWNQINQLDNLHFSSLQTFPPDYPYDNCYFYYSNLKIEASFQQKISIKRIEPEYIQNFTMAHQTYLAVSRIQNAEFFLSLAKILGANVFFISDCQRIEQMIDENDLNIQFALENNDSQSLLLTKSQIENLEVAAKQLFLKELMLTLTLIVIIAIIISVLLKRGRKEIQKSEKLEGNETIFP